MGPPFKKQKEKILKQKPTLLYTYITQFDCRTVKAFSISNAHMIVCVCICVHILHCISRQQKQTVCSILFNCVCICERVIWSCHYYSSVLLLLLSNSSSFLSFASLLCFKECTSNEMLSHTNTHSPYLPPTLPLFLYYLTSKCENLCVLPYRS